MYIYVCLSTVYTGHPPTSRLEVKGHGRRHDRGVVSEWFREFTTANPPGKVKDLLDVEFRMNLAATAIQNDLLPHVKG